jgi:WD40 repeat protein
VISILFSYHASTIVLTITTLHEVDLHSGRGAMCERGQAADFLDNPTDSFSIEIFETETGLITATLGPHSGPVTAVTWDRKSECILSASLDGSVGLWEVKTGMRGKFMITGHAEPVHFVEWTDEEAFAMTCSPDHIRAWDGCCLLTGWSPEMEDRANKYSGFTAASCSNRTSLLLAMAAEKGNLLVLANLLSADLLDSVRMEEPIRCLAWSPADELLAVGTAQSILMFRATHEGFEGPTREVSRHSSGVQALTFSGDGSLLACRDAQGLKIWDIETSQVVSELQEHTQAVSDAFLSSGIAFHPTEPLLATSTVDGMKLRIIELHT